MQSAAIRGGTALPDQKIRDVLDALLAAGAELVIVVTIRPDRRTAQPAAEEPARRRPQTLRR